MSQEGEKIPPGQCVAARGVRRHRIEELADSIGAVQARRSIYVLKTLLEGAPRGVTAADYQDPDRRCL